MLYPDGQFKFEEVPQPEPGKNPFIPNDVLIEVAYCGICGSDIHKWKDTDRQGLKGPSRAVVSGHEMSGTVIKVRPRVRDFKARDRVAGEIVTFYYGKCINCRTGRINLCANMNPSDQRTHYFSAGAFAKLQIAKVVGASPVIITGLTRDEPVRPQLAREVGADAAVNVKDTPDLVRPGGRILISGGGIRGGIAASLDTRKIIVKEWDIKGEISHL